MQVQQLGSISSTRTVFPAVKLCIVTMDRRLMLCVALVLLVLKVVDTPARRTGRSSNKYTVCSDQFRPLESVTNGTMCENCDDAVPISLCNCSNVYTGSTWTCTYENFSRIIQEGHCKHTNELTIQKSTVLSHEFVFPVNDSYKPECLGSFISTNMAIFLLAIVGLLLVALFILLDVRISNGRLNGLIFYAATIHLNQDAFFPHEKRGLLSLFLSWLNLDLGFSVCAFDGMSSTNKLWLQFVFPLYIMLVVVVVSFAFQYSIVIFNWQLSVAVLPNSVTLFLLAYLKVLRVSVFVISFIFAPGSEKLVRIHDINVDYFAFEHRMILFASVFFLLVIAIPYTFILITSRFLFKLGLFDESKSGLILNLILDMYTGRLKPSTQFWFGIILLFYSFQIAIYDFTGGDVILNLVVAILQACVLLLISLLLNGAYLKNLTNKMEQLFFLNLIAVSALALLMQHKQSTVYEYCTYILMFYSVTILSVTIAERWVTNYFPNFVLSPNEEPIAPTEETTDNINNPSMQTTWPDSMPDETYDSKIEPRSDFREPLLDDTVLTTNSTVSINHINNVPRNKTVTSSELVFKRGKLCGEADLILNQDFIHQRTEEDEYGVNTLCIQYSSTTPQTYSRSPSSSNQPVNSDVDSTVPKIMPTIEGDQRSVMNTDNVERKSKEPMSPDSSVQPYCAGKDEATKTKLRMHSRLSFPYHSLRKYRKRSYQRLSYGSNGRKKSVNLNPGSLVLASCIPSSLLTSTVMEVTNTGKKFSYQGILVDIPSGAISKGLKIQIEVGILAHGPFNYPKLMTRVSPVLWFCCRQFVCFNKSVKIVLPHCLKKVTTVGNKSLGLSFMKANYFYDHDLAGSSSFNFRPLDYTESILDLSEMKGSLQTTDQGCFFCLTANQSSPLLVKKTEYCLTRVCPKQLTSNSKVYFCVSYFLKSCLEDIEKQFPSRDFERLPTPFQFVNEPSVDPNVTIQVSSTENCFATVETTSEITAQEAHFSNDDDPSHQLKKECGAYPPRFQLRVCELHPKDVGAPGPATACVSFRGIVPPIDSTLVLPHNTQQCPVSVKAHESINFASGTKYRDWLERSSEYVPSSIPRNSYYYQLLQEIQESEDLKGLHHDPYWMDLEMVMPKVATKWREIGTLLINENALAIIDEDYRHESCTEKIRKVLKEWRVCGDLPYHWSSLIRVLQTDIVSETNLALQLSKVYCIELPYQ